MNLLDILIMNPDPNLCSCYSSEQLATLLRRNLPTGEIDIQSGVPFPSGATTSSSPDLILLRSSLIEDLHKILQALKAKWKAACILGIFCTRPEAPDAVFFALFNYLDEFIFCPFEETELFLRIQSIFDGNENAANRLPPRSMKESIRLDGLVGENEQFLRVIEKVPSVARCDATVLITGETGTGKELVARAIHYQSPRHAKPFIPVNCGALPDDLVENELFGHVRGAYTGAFSSKTGLLAEAEGGSLFLDEIDTLSLSGQVKLLRFLQDREYRPVGSSRSRSADVRIIAAAKSDIREQVQAKRFREDLYYRLHVISFLLPRLRERIDDIPRLADHFLSRYSKRYHRGSLRFASGCLKKLATYPWPGNIRELESIIKRGVILTSTPTLQPDDLALPLPDLGEVHGPASFSQAKARAVEQFERSYLTDLLTAHKGNVSRAAKSAGKDRRSFQRLLRKHGLDRAAFRKISD